MIVSPNESTTITPVIQKAYNSGNINIECDKRNGYKYYVENTSDYAVFSYKIRPSFDFRQELLSHGADIEVLEPKWFRDEIAEIITEQVLIYYPKKK